jgi:nucleoside-diphosphate-sugar epimerase
MAGRTEPPGAGERAARSSQQDGPVLRKRPRVVIAGATGFVGGAIREALAEDYDIVALTRSPTGAGQGDSASGIRWRHCDLFALDQVETALEDADFAIYLVHSMAPASRLTQARTEDLDLLLADTFGRAAARAGIRQIVFLGAVIPSGFEISRLLWSRRESEMALGAYGVPVTALRANLIVGPGGSSLQLMLRLVRRLPIIPLPRAAGSLTQPIALDDVVRAVRYCLGHPERFTGHFDIGGPEALSYVSMLRQTAGLLGRRRWTPMLPLIPLGLAARVLRWVSGAPAALVDPLVESLRADTPVRDNPVQEFLRDGALSYREALTRALQATRGDTRAALRRADDRLIREQSVVRSIQRLVLPPGQDADWVAGNYFRWLPRLGWPFLRCDFDATDSCAIHVRFPPVHLLTLTREPEQDSPGRRVYRVTAGRLLRGGSTLQGRFEFREVLGARYVIAGIHDYPPALPWYVYVLTQAPIHLLVMKIYQRGLSRLIR